MSFWQFWKWGNKSHTMATAIQTGSNTASWMDRQGKVFADEGYTRNGPAFRCVNIIATSLGSIEITASEGKGDDKVNVPDHPILALLNRPNPTTGGSAFIEAFASYRLISGNSYVEAITDGKGVPRELRIWTPYDMQVIISKNTKLPVAYMWKSGNDEHIWLVDEITLQSDMLQWKTFNPLNPNIGLSPMEAAAYTIDQHNASSEWNQALLQNAATPDGMLVSKGKLTDSQYEKLHKEIEQNYSGPANAKRPMLADDSLEWVQISMSPKDMDWLNGRAANAVDIAMVFGVPVQLLGIKGSQTFANFEQARLSLWEDNVIPMEKDLLAELNNWLVPMFDPEGKLGLKLGYNPKSIPALAEKESETLKNIDALSFMTISEKRDIAGLERIDVDGIDDIWIPSGLLPLGLDIIDMASEDAAVKALMQSGKTEEHAQEIVAKYFSKVTCVKHHTH